LEKEKNMIRNTVLGIAALVALGQASAGAGPWPADVAGWKPVKPGEHPRLFFRRSDIPALRARAKTPEGRAVIRRLRFLLNRGDGASMPTAYNPARGKPPRDGSGPTAKAPAGMYTMSHTAGYGLLYVLTGEKKYAELGRQAMEKALEGFRDRDNRYSFKFPNGALRAGPSLGWTAVGYDLCHDGWDEDFRRKVTEAIFTYNEGKNMSLAELVRGSRHMPASNHWGMQVGGGALAVLAIMGDPGTDAAVIDKLLVQSRKAMIRNMTEGFGDHGWFAEGDGTGSMSSHIVFASALNAWKVAAGKDFIAPRPNAPWMTLKWIFLTIPRNGNMDFPKRGAYPHNVWDRTGLSGAGYFAQGFGAVTEAQKGALLWFYNHHLKARDEKAGTPFDTPSIYPHNAVMAFINWPIAMKEVNPAQVIPRAVRDEKCGFAMFRNRWQDENDIVVSVQTRNTRGWHKANTRGDVMVWGLGKKQKWGRLREDIALWQPAADGSAIVGGSKGTCLAVDFSGASGADGMLVMTGPGAPGDNVVKAGDAEFSFLFLTQDPPPAPRVAGDTVVVGKQKVSLQSGRIVLGTMAGPWKGPGA
jgi:hypothetical protein